MNSYLFQRHQARVAQRIVEVDRINAHAKVALMLRDNHAREAVISEAREQIKKWRDNKLCSSDFIQAWEALLSEPMKAADVLEDMAPVSIRLRQNSPFAAYL